MSFQVDILSLKDFCERIRRMGDKHAVSIRDPRRPRTGYRTVDHSEQRFASLLKLHFHDIESEWEASQVASGHGVMPQRDHVATLINWAKGKNNFAIHCTAGVSRSSAAAYILACMHMSPKQALSVLDFNRHSPNRLMVRHAAALLKKPEMIPLIASIDEAPLVIGEGANQEVIAGGIIIPSSMIVLPQ